MKKIKLTQGKWAIVDNEDFEFLSQWKWSLAAKNNRRNFYAKRAGSRKEKIRKYYEMHHELLKPTKGMVVDHINGNGLDNRRKNIRLVTIAENQWNRKKSKNTGTFRKKGSQFKKPWYALLWANKKFYYRGYFEKRSEARKAYRSLWLKHHKGLGRWNIE